jgi:hypothetical protein
MRLRYPGAVARTWCFYPEGRLSKGDVMLAQKVALETFEGEALKIANSVVAFPCAHSALPRQHGR